MKNPQDIGHEIRVIVNKYSLLLSQIDEKTFAHKISDSKWSKKEILGHLVDSAINNIRRFVVTQYEETPITKYEQNAWVRLSNYQNWKTIDIINAWSCANLHIAQVIHNISNSNLNKEFKVTDEKTYSLEFGINDYVNHLNHHLNQII